jgi:hypothetical protein
MHQGVNIFPSLNVVAAHLIWGLGLVAVHEAAAACRPIVENLQPHGRLLNNLRPLLDKSHFFLFSPSKLNFPLLCTCILLQSIANSKFE